jgi:PAS domain S-box-containing protein
MRDKRKAKTDLSRYLEALHDHIAWSELEKGVEKGEEYEQIFRVIFDNAADGILLADVKSRKLYMGNKVICQMLGCNEDELQNLGVMDIHPEESLSYVIEQFEKQMKGELTLAKDMPVIRKDGSVFYADINAFPITFGEKAYLMGIFRDITERRKMEETLRQSEERYRSVVDDLPGLICSFLPDGEITFVNAAYCEYFGKTSEELIGSKFTSLIPEEDRQAVLNDILSLTADSPLITHEHKVTASDGQIRWQRWTNRAIFNEQGCVVSFQSFGEDITERRQAEEQIRKLGSAIEQSMDGIGIGDMESRILYVNDAYARMHGYTYEEMLGMNAAVLQSDEYTEKYKRANYLIKTEGSWSGEMMHVRKDGTDFPVYMSVTLLRNEIGQAAGIIGVCRDITDYKKAQEALAIRSAAIASSINGIAIGDADGNLTYVNNSFLEMWGFKDQNEVIGRNAAEFWLGSNEASMVVEELREKGGWIGEMTAVKKDGSVFDVQVCATSVTDDNNMPISMMGSFIDITESKRSQEQLNAYREKMARTEQLASLGTLSATLAHELTQPLTVIRLLLESAMEKIGTISSSENFANKLEDSLYQVSSMVAITERFRNFARRSSGRIVGEVDLRTVAQRIVNLLSESAKRTQVALRLEDWDELQSVYWNENDLEQLFFALVNNAIQAADGEKDRCLVIRGIMKDKNIELQFSDNCGGISPDVLDRIFEPFFTTKPPGQGTGLGLCIVQDIVTRVGGKIRAESRYGEGSTFFVTLPMSEDRTPQLGSGK